MSTPEGKIKDAIKDVIKEVPGTYALWVVPFGRGESTLDCIGARPFDGKFFGVEAKKPNERDKMTDLQKSYARRMLRSRGMVFCIDDKNGVDIALFRKWLNGDDSIHMESFARILALVGPLVEGDEPTVTPKAKKAKPGKAPA